MTLLAQGLTLHRAGRLDEASSCYAQLLKTEPHHAQALHLMGMIAMSNGEYPQAISLILHALQSTPQLAASHFNLGVAYKETGRRDEAVAAFRDALAIAPDDADTHYSLGNALKSGSDAAIAAYRQAILLAPQHADAHNNLGIALESRGALDDAIASYRSALTLHPCHAEAGNNLGGALQERGEMADSAKVYRKAIACSPNFAEARWGLAMCGLPAVCLAQDTQTDSREIFSAALAELDLWLTPEHLGTSLIVGAKQPFYLAYQDENNRDLLSRYGDLCIRLMQRWAQPIPASTHTLRLKVGIVSAHIHDHSVWNAFVRAWLQHLDADRFELSVFHLGQEHDAETEYAKTRAHYFGEQQDLNAWADTIRTQQPDVLIYPEIGMDATTLQLACLRLAPLQVASWGHPETSGLSTMDFYLSAQGFETTDAQDNYREKLFTLPALGCCYHALPTNPVAPDLVQLGIDEGVPLLLCPGSPFKYGAEHDRIFIRIAQELIHCQFVFFTHSITNLTQRLRQRLQQAFSDAGLDFDRYCRFIPWQKRDAFYGLMARADVMLDTIGFSGFNTAMQAMECALPIVTREGRFMRGNLASGILNRLDLQELVAATDEDYITIAVRLAQDADYRQALRSRIMEARHILFDDMLPIRAMEEFLLGLRGTDEQRLHALSR